MNIFADIAQYGIIIEIYSKNVKQMSIKLIIGLGNPGTQYANTRHNVGFMAVDFLAGENAVWKKESRFIGASRYLIAKTDNAVFIKPQTFMNLSGLAVQAAMTKYKIPLENITVIHDDIDIQLGDVRVKTGGGNAGHNGLKSISGLVGNEYRRIRIGIGRPENPKIETSDWVLGKFSPEERETVDKIIQNLGDF